jgi:hypothetical protein
MNDRLHVLWKSGRRFAPKASCGIPQPHFWPTRTLISIEWGRLLSECQPANTLSIPSTVKSQQLLWLIRVVPLSRYL